MTTPIVDLKCPACGHLIGEEEHERVRANFDRLVQLESNGEIEQIRYECEVKNQNMERNIEDLANQKAESKISAMDIRHRGELAEKDRQSRIN